MAVTGPGSHIQASQCADPWTEAASLGLIGFPPALEIP